LLQGGFRRDKAGSKCSSIYLQINSNLYKTEEQEQEDEQEQDNHPSNNVELTKNKHKWERALQLTV